MITKDPHLSQKPFEGSSQSELWPTDLWALKLILPLEKRTDKHKQNKPLSLCLSPVSAVIVCW